MSEPTTNAAPATPDTIYYDNCIIKDAGLFEPRIPDRAAADDYEVGFTVTVHEDGKPDQDVEVNLEVSAAYGVGNNSSKTRAQIAIETCGHLGYQHGADLTKIAELIGKPCRITAKRSQKGYWNYYFNTSRPKVRANNIAERMARLMGQQVAPAAAPAPEANPFS